MIRSLVTSTLARNLALTNREPGATHWGQAFLPLEEPIALTPGASIDVGSRPSTATRGAARAAGSIPSTRTRSTQRHRTETRTPPRWTDLRAPRFCTFVRRGNIKSGAAATALPKRQHMQRETPPLTLTLFPAPGEGTVLRAPLAETARTCVKRFPSPREWEGWWRGGGSPRRGASRTLPARAGRRDGRVGRAIARSPPSDPDVQISRIRLFRSCFAVDGLNPLGTMRGRGSGKRSLSRSKSTHGIVARCDRRSTSNPRESNTSKSLHQRPVVAGMPN